MEGYGLDMAMEAGCKAYMGSLFKTTRNTRALPTGDLRFIRSDCPTNMTDDEVQWLWNNGITTIVDLRENEEANENPCRLETECGFRYYRIPVTGGGNTPKSLEHLPLVYSQMLDGQMEKIIDLIMNAKSNVMYFCTAGKDRTGVVSAILLKKAGFL